MKFEGIEQPQESFPKISEPMVAHMIQIRLMPLSFRLDNDGAEINMADKEVRNRVAGEWAERYAEAFREYAEDHPNETLNVHDEEALVEFLTKVKEYAAV